MQEQSASQGDTIAMLTKETITQSDTQQVMITVQEEQESSAQEEQMQEKIEEQTEPDSVYEEVEKAQTERKQDEILNLDEAQEVSSEPELTQSLAAEYSSAQKYSQVVIVQSSGTRAVVTMHEQQDGVWTEILRTKGFVGSQGVGTANSEEAITPQGTFPLYFAFGVKPNPGTSVSYLQVDDMDYWVGDSKSPLYNQYVRTETPFTEWDDAERLIDYPRSYAYGMFIGYNAQGTPYKGSCFFLHCSVGTPTEGCVAVPEEDMVFILRNVSSNCGIIIE